MQNNYVVNSMPNDCNINLRLTPMHAAIEQPLLTVPKKNNVQRSPYLVPPIRDTLRMRHYHRHVNGMLVFNIRHRITDEISYYHTVG